MTRAKAKRHVCLPSNDLLERCLTIPNMQPPLPSYISHIYCTFFTHLQISQTSQTTNTFHHTLLDNETKGRRSYRNWRRKSWVTLLRIGKLVWIEDHFTKRVPRLLVSYHTISSPPFGVVSLHFLFHYPTLVHAHHDTLNLRNILMLHLNS